MHTETGSALLNSAQVRLTHKTSVTTMHRDKVITTRLCRYNSDLCSAAGGEVGLRGERGKV